MGIAFPSSHALSYSHWQSGFHDGYQYWAITFPVVVPFDILIDPVPTSTRTDGQVFIAGIILGITFPVLIPFRTFVEPVLTSRELAVRFS
jgi:hypothetical protein